MSLIHRTDTPLLPGYYKLTEKVERDGVLIKVPCDFCRQFHTHGGGMSLEDFPRYCGHRVAHCGPKRVGKQDIRSPYEDTGYEIHPAGEFTKEVEKYYKARWKAIRSKKVVY